MKPLRLGIVVQVDDCGARLRIEEAQTGARYAAQYLSGRAISSGTAMSSPRLGRRHAQGKNCILKAPDVGDAVCFETAGRSARILHWGYVNRFLLAAEDTHKSRFLPRLVA